MEISGKWETLNISITSQLFQKALVWIAFTVTHPSLVEEAEKQRNIKLQVTLSSLNYGAWAQYTGTFIIFASFLYQEAPLTHVLLFTWQGFEKWYLL